MEEALVAATFVAKYGGIIVMSDLQPHVIFPLLLERLNIYTDPQRPMTAGQGVYPINNPDENSAGARDLQLLAYLLYRIR